VGRRNHAEHDAENVDDAVLPAEKYVGQPSATDVRIGLVVMAAVVFD
jgi:hypothetical protein